MLSGFCIIIHRQLRESALAMRKRFSGGVYADYGRFAEHIASQQITLSYVSACTFPACGRAFPACPNSLFGGTDEAFPNDGRGCPVSLRSVFVPLIRGVWRGEREVDPRRCVPDGCAEGASPAFRRSVSRIRNVKIFYFRECIIIHKRVFLSCIPEVFRLRACRRLRTVKGGEVCKQL